MMRQYFLGSECSRIKNKGYTICIQPRRFRDESGQCHSFLSSVHGNLAASLDVVVRLEKGTYTVL